MIHTIEVEDILSVAGNLRAELAPITLLYGEDDATKSTLLKSLGFVQDVSQEAIVAPLGKELELRDYWGHFDSSGPPHTRRGVIRLYVDAQDELPGLEVRIRGKADRSLGVTLKPLPATEGESRTPTEAQLIRAFLDRIVAIGSPRVVSGGDYVAALHRVLSTLGYFSMDIVQRVNDELARIGIDAELTIDRVQHEPTFRASLREPRGGLAVDLGSTGSGMNHLLQLLAPIVASQGRIFTLCHPEAYKHPTLQLALGDLLAGAVGPERGNQFVVQTHSEHLLLRLLRRIRETTEGSLPPGRPKLTPAQVSVLYVARGPDGPALQRLRINSNGEFLDRWPNGFFDERMAELF